METLKRPALKSVKGNYILPQDVREKYGLEEILTLEARYWSNAEKLIDTYFSTVFTWEKSPKSIFKTLIDGLYKFSKSEDTKEATRQYSERVFNYLRQPSAFEKFKSYYSIKEMEYTAKRQVLLARLEGDISGAILSQRGAKRAAEEGEEDNEPTTSWRRKVDVFLNDEVDDESVISENFLSFDDINDNNNNDNFINLEQDKKKFNFQAPYTRCISPHRPLIEQKHIMELKPLFDVCFSSNSESCSEKLKELFDRYQEDQRNNRPGAYQSGDERTFFCEVIVPLFKSFGNCTGQIKFKWGEKKIDNLRYIWIINNDFDKDVKIKLLDGIGELDNILPYLLIESSGFNQDENIDHTLGDSLKNIKSTSDSLKYFISNFKNASFKSIQEVHLYSVQVIQKKVTLVQSSLSNNATWQVVECRGASIPTDFEDIELYNDMIEQKSVYKKLRNESLGLVPLQKEETVGAVLSEYL
ncbi:hypothetical protein HPULCUR_002196 [Helicostylum pulchrum]|uniref:Uncharacterized protein n=1 Tax=Helicostylum pulchrum TaxID=562976 RepID=A0ABP9XQY1_9FUNG